MMLARRSIEAVMMMYVLAGCTESHELAMRTTGGDPERGRIEMKRHSCGVCHVIPGVRGARGQVGPTLEAYDKRVYVAGKFSKEPQILTQWISDAPSLSPETAMPAIEMSEQQARDMAAYLYTLK